MPTLFLSRAEIETRRKLLKESKTGMRADEQGCRRVLETDPFDYIALMALGDACEKKGRIEEARRYYWRALQAQPGDSESYVCLSHSFTKTGDDLELGAGLSRLATWRALRDGPEDLSDEFLRDVKRAAGTSDLDEALAVAHSMAVDPPDEPRRVRDLLQPYRLIQDVIDPPEDGMNSDTVDDILDCGEACQPLLIGVLRGWARNQIPGFFPADAALALLGEIGDAEALPAVLEFTELEDEAMSDIAVWAAHSIAERCPEAAAEVRHLPSANDELDVYEICCSPPDEEEEEEERAPVRRPVRPGRNEPCWCGSGKKYKKCHLAADEESDRREAEAPPEAAPAETADTSQPAMTPAATLLLKFADDNLKEQDLTQALKLFFGRAASDLSDLDQMSFLDWLTHDHVPRRFGRTIPEEYLARNRARLSSEDREAVEGWMKGHYGIFEVQRIEEGEGVEVKDLLFGDSFFVHDVSTSRNAARWDCILCRVFEDQGRKKFSATGLLVMPSLRERFRDWILADQRVSGLDWPAYLRANSHRLRQKCNELSKERQDSLQMVTAEGDPLVFARASYEVLDRPKLLAALDGSPVLGDCEDERGAVHYAWFERPETKDDEPRRVLGHVQIQEKRLILECQSRERLKRGVSLLSALAGKALRAIGEEFESAEAAMRKAASSARAERQPEVPREIQQQVIDRALKEHYRKWVDEPLPALRGLTPREASRLAEQHDRLIGLLKMMENGEERKRKAGDPWFDFSGIKAELGVEY